jgi:hypothetical protein
MRFLLNAQEHTKQSLTQTNHTRWCINTIRSPDDEHLMLETCREMKWINKYMKKCIRLVINKKFSQPIFTIFISVSSFLLLLSLPSSRYPSFPRQYSIYISFVSKQLHSLRNLLDFTKQRANSTEQSASWETFEEIPYAWWNIKFCYCVRNKLSLVSSLIQMNPIRNIPYFFFKIHFNIYAKILQATSSLEVFP